MLASGCLSLATPNEMKPSCICVLFLISISTTIAQTIKVLETDSATFYVNTEVNYDEWGGHTFDGQKHTAIKTYAYSTYDGAGNTKKIVEALGEGNAAYTCDALVVGDHSDWYLPSLDECKMIYKEYNDDMFFQTNWYWTSSDYENLNSDDFFDGDIYAWKKWFGGGEGDIAELQFKNTDWLGFFCIRKEWKIAFPSFEIETTAVSRCDEDNGSASLNVTGGSNGYVFQWFIGAGPGGDYFYEGTEATNLASGVYRVVAVHTATQQKSEAVVFEILDQRVIPEVSIETEGNKITATPFSEATYSWFLDEEPLNVTSHELMAEASGQYTVLVTSLGCVAEASINLIITGSEPGSGAEVSIYPNPGNGLYNVKGITPGSNLVVRTLLGEILYQQFVTSAIGNLDLSALPPSVYFVSLENAGRVEMVRLVKR